MKIRPSLALAVLLIGSMGAASADTLHVPRDHKTIQAAIDSASAADTVLVAAGTYRERLRLKENLTLRSAGDDAKGSFESETDRKGVNVTGGQAIIENNRVEKPKPSGVKDIAPSKPQ